MISSAASFGLLTLALDDGQACDVLDVKECHRLEWLIGLEGRLSGVHVWSTYLVSRSAGNAKQLFLTTVLHVHRISQWLCSQHLSMRSRRFLRHDSSRCTPENFVHHSQAFRHLI